MEAAIVARLIAALTLPDQAHPKVEVRAWPEKARDYKMTHPNGCAMVIYKGSNFHDNLSTSGQLINFEADFELGLISRTLREPNMPEPGAALGVGIYDLLETCRRALFGWRPEQAAGPVRITAESFDDYSEGTWGYSLNFNVPMMTVAERPCPPGPWADAGSINACCDTAPPITQLTFDPQN